MQEPPPILTPMERQLLMRLQRLDEALQAKVAAQDAKITALETQIKTRNQAIADLSNLLERLLGPSAPA